MLTVYVIATVVGGVFVLLSAIGGHDHDKELDLHGELDMDVDIDADADAEIAAEADAHDADADAHADIWLPFLSMRFWTYFLAFFGVTGLLLTYLWRAGVPTGLLSTGMGLTCGLGMAYGTRYLRNTGTHSRAGVQDLLGQEADVIIDTEPGQVGKIRCRAKGRSVDLLARSDDDEHLEAGSRVLIIGFAGTDARVVRAAYAAPADIGELQDEAAAAEVEVEVATKG